MIIYTTLSVITQHSHILWPLHRNPIETENYQFEVIIHALPLQNFCSLQLYFRTPIFRESLMKIHLQRTDRGDRITMVRLAIDGVVFFEQSPKG